MNGTTMHPARMVDRRTLTSGVVMATAVQGAEKIVVYDGDCSMCRGTIAALVRARLVRPDQTRSNHDLSDADFAIVNAAGIRNQLVVLDLRTRETRAGTDGLLWFLREKTGNNLLVRLFGLPGFRHLLRVGYEAISYNRRIISPPRNQIVCDCEPEATLARRLTLIVPVLLCAVLLVALFGATAFHAGELGDALAGALLALLGISGLAVMIVVALVALPADKRIDYIGHLAITTLAGALLLVPAMLVSFALVPSVRRLIAADSLSVLVSAGLMFAMQRRRTAVLALSQRWLWGWVVALGVGIGAAAALSI